MQEDPPEPQEKRKNPRVKGAYVEYTRSSNDDLHKPAFLKDISPGGIGLFLYEAIELNAPLYMRIFLPGSDDPVIATGRVVWRKKSVFLSGFDLGVKVVEIEEDSQQRLAEYIINHMVK